MRRRYIRRYALFLDFLLAVALVFCLAPNIQGAKSDRTGPGVNVDVNALDNNSGSFAMGQSHTWILRGGIPPWIATAKNYILLSEIDPRLTLEPGILVNLHTGDGKQLHLRAREHYQLERGTAGGASRLRLALTPAGLAYAGENLIGETELRISFRASINQTAPMGAAIPGTAQLTCTDSAGRTFASESDRAEVHTGGIQIVLTDGIQQPLAGARFRLARLATDKDQTGPNTSTELLYIDGEQKQVVFVPFYDRNSEQVTEMTTDGEGRAQACGLPYGSYYLVESEAPSGYNRMTPSIPVEVNEVSHLTAADGWKDMEDNLVDNTVTVVNTKFILPETGGTGTAAFALLGICMVGALCPMLLRRCRRYG